MKLRKFVLATVATVVVMGAATASAATPYYHYQSENPKPALEQSTCRILPSPWYLPKALEVHVPYHARYHRCRLDFFIFSVDGCPTGGYIIYNDYSKNIWLSTPPGYVSICGDDQRPGAMGFHVVLHSKRRHNKIEFVNLSIRYCLDAVECLYLAQQ
jgi:hypothetical protein